MGVEHRRRNDYTLDELRNEIALFAQRLEVIEAAVSEIDRRLYDHLKDEDDNVQQLREAIHVQTVQITGEVKAVRDSIETLRANLLVLTIKGVGHSMWNAGEWMHAMVKWWSPILAFILLSGAVIIWLMGKGPYPK